MTFAQVRVPSVANAPLTMLRVIHRIRPTRPVKGDPRQWNLYWNNNSEWRLCDVSLPMLPLPNTEDRPRPGVPPGTYVLSVITHDFSFDQVSI